MTTISRAGLLAAAFGTLLATGGCVTDTSTAPNLGADEAATDRRIESEAVLNQWSSEAALVARGLIERYDIPDEVRDNRLVWNGVGPWKRTIAWNVAPSSGTAPDEDLGVIEQTLDASLSLKQAVDVAAFDDNVVYNPRTETLSVRSDREELNYLRMNLAHDVIVGKLNPVEAREDYASIVSYEKSGKSSPYLKSLRFSGDVTEAP